MPIYTIENVHRHPFEDHCAITSGQKMGSLRGRTEEIRNRKHSDHNGACMNWDKEEGKISEDILTFFIWKIVTHVYYATHFIDTNKLNPHNFLKRQKDWRASRLPNFL